MPPELNINACVQQVVQRGKDKKTAQSICECASRDQKHEKADDVLYHLATNALKQTKKADKMQTNALIMNMEVREETHENKLYLVAPVILIVEGVMNGQLCLEEEFGRYPDAWNGIPLPVNHPEERGMPVSANRPDLIDNQCVGRLFNAFVDGNKLKGEIWVDIEKAKSLGGEAAEVLKRMKNKEPLEVSTAYFSDFEPEEGVFNGEEYDAIQRNLRPDHLALLPNEIGACNWEDGCGVRANQTNDKERGETVSDKSIMNKLKEFFSNMQQSAETLVDNELSNEKKKHKIVDQLVKDKGSHFAFDIEGVFDDYAIYQELDQNMEPYRLMKQYYTIDEDERVTLGEKEEVKKVETYEPISANQEGGPANDSTTKGEGVTNQMDKAKLIQINIDSKNTSFTSNDKETLEKMDEKALKSMLSKEDIEANEEEGASSSESEEGASAAEGGTEGNGKESSANEGKEAEGEGDVTGNQTQQQDKPKTMEEWLEQAPDQDFRDFALNSVQKQKQHRADLVKGLANNKNCAFEKEELEKMGTNQLEKLDKSLEVNDYSAVGGPRFNREEEDDEEIPSSPSVLFANKKEKEEEAK